MCTSPIYKRNPNYRASAAGASFHAFKYRDKHGEHCLHYSNRGATDYVSEITKDTEHAYLRLPCGHCADCLAVRQASYVQRLQAESEYNHFFFATLTYDNNHLPVLHLDRENASYSLTNSSSKKNRKRSKAEVPSPVSSLSVEDASILDAAYGLQEELAELRGPSDSASDSVLHLVPPSDSLTIDIPFADIHHLQLMFKRMRDNNRIGRPFRYIAVSERGSERGRPHFHIIFLIPKHPGDTVASCITLNESLKDMLLEFWSTNVGTYKNPVYERNFTYRQRWIGGKLNRNFDCHYVDPKLTTSGVANVVYYTSKYIFKESDRDNKLRKLVWATAAGDVTQFYAVWDIVKSRLVCSKGLGLDGHCETVVESSERLVPERNDTFFFERHILSAMEDLPEDDFVLTESSPLRWRQVSSEKKRRIMVANPDLFKRIKDNACAEPASGRAVFIDYNGKHLPLASYYSKRVLDINQLTDLYYSWDPLRYPKKDYYAADYLTKDDVDEAKARLDRIRAQIDAHEVYEGRAEDVELFGMDIDPYSNYRSPAKLVGAVKPLNTIRKW